MPGSQSVQCAKSSGDHYISEQGLLLVILGACPIGDQRPNYDLLISIPMIGAGASWSRNGLSQAAAAECVRHEKPSASTAGGIELGKNMLESSL